MLVHFYVSFGGFLDKFFLCCRHCCVIQSIQRRMYLVLSSKCVPVRFFYRFCRFCRVVIRFSFTSHRLCSQLIYVHILNPVCVYLAKGEFLCDVIYVHFMTNRDSGGMKTCIHYKIFLISFLLLLHCFFFVVSSGLCIMSFTMNCSVELPFVFIISVCMDEWIKRF